MDERLKKLMSKNWKGCNKILFQAHDIRTGKIANIKCGTHTDASTGKLMLCEKCQKKN